MKSMLWFLFVILSSNFTIAPSSGLSTNASRSMEGVGPAQDKGAQVELTVAARRSDLIQLAGQYGIEMNKQDWSHEQLAICPAFSRHFFIKYSDARVPNADFIAIYPRAGGRIRIVRLGSPLAPSISKSTMITFNAVWSDERNGSGLRMVSPSLDWASLGQCYAEIAGEHPVIDLAKSAIESIGKLEHLDSEHDGTSRLVFEVKSNSKGRSSLSIDFDKSGSVVHVEHTESGGPIPISDDSLKP